MPKMIPSALEDWTAYWNACVTSDARNESKSTEAIATLMRLALHEPNTVGGLAAEELMERFGARVMMA
jgi:hypothetical protein